MTATTQNGDPTNVWVMGKANPGWYMAKQIWNEKYAEHLRSLGYMVERSQRMPEPK